jgi:exopolyphosphatase / guanosine-5'-triphosphate,3'-diphosphate pyrophosphatase
LYAAIDVGSNTVRMLIGRCTATGIKSKLYRQRITRLGGNYVEGKGLALDSLERTLSAFSDYADILQEMDVKKVRVVGTAALRRAENSQHLVNLIKLKTRMRLEIINGREEARLSSAGVLSAIDPYPETSLIIDIGGGSTEFVFYDKQRMLFTHSYPLGVVQLCEELSDVEKRAVFIEDMIDKFSADLIYAGITPEQLNRTQLIGTAGTITTLAAMDLRLAEYNPDCINNHLLKLDWLLQIQDKLQRLNVSEREELPGLEQGRGDLIIPGLELLLALFHFFEKDSILVADAGLLEGILLDFCHD